MSITKAKQVSGRKGKCDKLESCWIVVGKAERRFIVYGGGGGGEEGEEEGGGGGLVVVVPSRAAIGLPLVPSTCVLCTTDTSKSFWEGSMEGKR